MNYENYYYGMNVIWWIIWIVLLVWIFFLPIDIPGQRRKKETAFEILRKRFAEGSITESEYKDKKKVLEKQFKRS